MRQSPDAIPPNLPKRLRPGRNALHLILLERSPSLPLRLSNAPYPRATSYRAYFLSMSFIHYLLPRPRKILVHLVTLNATRSLGPALGALPRVAFCLYSTFASPHNDPRVNLSF